MSLVLSAGLDIFVSVMQLTGVTQQIGIKTDQVLLDHFLSGNWGYAAAPTEASKLFLLRLWASAFVCTT